MVEGVQARGSGRRRLFPRAPDEADGKVEASWCLPVSPDRLPPGRDTQVPQVGFLSASALVEIVCRSPCSISEGHLPGGPVVVVVGRVGCCAPSCLSRDSHLLYAKVCRSQACAAAPLVRTGNPPSPFQPSLPSLSQFHSRMGRLRRSRCVLHLCLLSGKALALVRPTGLLGQLTALVGRPPATHDPACHSQSRATGGRLSSLPAPKKSCC